MKDRATENALVEEIRYTPQPGIHSYNARRLIGEVERPTAPLRWLTLSLLVVGLACSGFYIYGVADRYVYQSYENWVFEQAIAGRSAVNFADFLHEKLAGTKALEPSDATRAKPALVPKASRLAEGDLVARLSIKRLNIQSMVREGVSAKTLRVAVGHVPTTALPGQQGNCAIAAHRDTLFRALKDVRTGDDITVQSPSETYVYQVVATKIVSPSDVSVLRADGGGLYHAPAAAQPAKLLTMITCYPFYYVGSAPKRFIVECSLISSSVL